MKKKGAVLLLLIILLSLNPFLVEAQNKNSISIESGYFFGGPAAKISNQMETDGFGDDLSGSWFGGTTSYPRKEKRGLRYWLRYERELKNNRSIELSFGNVNNSSVFGNNLSTRISPNYQNILYAFKANYLFYTAKSDAAVGGGPAIVYYKLQPAQYSPYGNTESKSYILPGLSVTALWKFVNTKNGFMSIRTDESFTTSATINKFTATGNGTTEFKGTKAGSFVGSVTVGVGINF